MAKQARRAKARKARKSSLKDRYVPLRGRGKPTNYRVEFNGIATTLCDKYGATLADLADAFSVDIATVKRWMQKYPDFRAAVVLGRDAADARVEFALYERAVGYTYDSEKIIHDRGRVIRVAAREHVPPDVGAAFNWLKNRKPKDWRDANDKSVGDVFVSFPPEIAAMLAADIGDRAKLVNGKMVPVEKVEEAKEVTE